MAENPCLGLRSLSALRHGLTPLGRTLFGRLQAEGVDPGPSERPWGMGERDPDSYRQKSWGGSIRWTNAPLNTAHVNAQMLLAKRPGFRDKVVGFELVAVLESSPPILTRSGYGPKKGPERGGSSSEGA